MKTFAVTFAGLATRYVEAETKKEAEKKECDNLIKRNEDGGNLLLVVPVSDEALSAL